MKKILLFTLLTFLWTSGALAQSLVPATSEDLSAFDEQISQTQSSSQFGAAVAAEAKKLQKSQAVKESKNKDSLQGVKENVSKNASASSATDAKVSSPKNSDRGNSANAPGRNKKVK